KSGLNGVDNGILSFDHVRIPRENLLSKYPVANMSDGARFNITIAALVATRVALCFQAIGPTKLGLEIAIKYALQRRQFGNTGDGSEQLIMDYQTHQMRLMPKLATVLATTFATRYACQLLNDDVCGKVPLHQDRQMQALVAGLKAYTTWEAIDTLQICRECCGGQGFMEVNRLASLKRDADVFVTFEGDNTVLLQQVAKDLLAQYSSQFGGSKLKAVIHTLSTNIKAKLQSGLKMLRNQNVTSIAYVLNALEFKQDLLLRNLAARLMDKVRDKRENPLSAWNDCLDHVSALSLAYVHQISLKKFVEAVKRCPEKDDKVVLHQFCLMYAMHLLHGERAWLLEQRYMTPIESKLIRDTVSHGELYMTLPVTK
ncbi:hypothetical protein CAPTEDRAFT_143276, partial [Capitella teleta]